MTSDLVRVIINEKPGNKMTINDRGGPITRTTNTTQQRQQKKSCRSASLDADDVRAAEVDQPHVRRAGRAEPQEEELRSRMPPPAPLF